MPESQAEKKPVVLEESNLKTVFVDSLRIETRADGLHLVRLFASLPEGWSEQARLMISDAALNAMLKVLSEHCASWLKDNSNPEEPGKE